MKTFIILFSILLIVLLIIGFYFLVAINNDPYEHKIDDEMQRQYLYKLNEKTKQRKAEKNEKRKYRRNKKDT